MSADKTARHELPLLAVGQAQKEVTHNEALIRLDALLYPVVEASLSAPPANMTASNDGQCWLINPAATGAWQAKDHHLARWSGGSWRFIKPIEGMATWNINLGRKLVYTQNQWVAAVAIADPSGGSVVDAEARTALSAILAHLRAVSSLAV
jgi:hypothetical protein